MAEAIIFLTIPGLFARKSLLIWMSRLLARYMVSRMKTFNCEAGTESRLNYTSMMNIDKFTHGNVTF